MSSSTNKRCTYVEATTAIDSAQEGFFFGVLRVCRRADVTEKVLVLDSYYVAT